jgi:hypothetical protein
VGTVLQAAQVLDSEYVTEKVVTLLGDGDRADEVIERMHADELERGGVLDDDTEDIDSLLDGIGG